jgi:hypothetical protein
LTDRACPGCGQALTVGAVLALYGRRLRTGLREATAVRCPVCREPNPISAKTCGHCHEAITFGRVLEPVRAPARTFFSRPPRTARWTVQLLVLALSAGGLLWAADQTRRFGWQTLAIGSGLAVFFLAAALFLAPWLWPRSEVRALARQASGATRLALLLNGLTLLLLVTPALGVYWTLAVVPAAALFGVYLAGSLMARTIWPEYVAGRDAWREAGRGTLNPRDRQGRQADHL